MNNERISIPELLFHPSDIGIDQAGLSEMIQQSISTTIPAAHEPFYSSILVFGGNALFPNFQQRLYVSSRVRVGIICVLKLMNRCHWFTNSEQEVRQLAPADYNVEIHIADEYVAITRPCLSGR